MRIRLVAMTLVATSLLVLAGGCTTTAATPPPTAPPRATVVITGADGLLREVPAPPGPPSSVGRPKSTPTPALLSPEERARLVTPRPRPSVSATLPPITTPVHPPGWSTGVPEVDAVITALLSGDEERIRTFVGTRAVECAGTYTTMHPASTICEGKPEGSTSEGFARGAGEWRYYDLEREKVLVSAGWKGVYAVVRIDSSDIWPEVYQWARPGDYVVILVPPTGIPPFEVAYALVEDGKLVGSGPVCCAAARAVSEDGFAKNGTLVLPPPPDAPPYARATPRAPSTPQAPPTFATAPTTPTSGP